jgi:predicted nucleotidyltransferase
MIIVTEKVLHETVAAIVQEMDPGQSYLFGSRACGEARPDANIDLLIVEQAPFGPCRSRLRPSLHNSCHSKVGHPSLCRLSWRRPDDNGKIGT